MKNIGNYTLYNGVKIPKIGFGMWQIKDGDEAYNSTIFALKAGYRHIDTAYVYGNEKSCGRAIKDFGIDRKELFITSKLPSDIKTYDGTIEYFNKTIENLGVEYLDLYLIHAPWPWSEIGKDCKEGNIEAWRAMIDLYNAKKIRSIGVSNFSVDDIENIVKATGFKPMVNQIRFFVGNTQDKVTNYCKANDILVEAYSPLATGEILNNEILKKMAEKYNVTVAKLCLNYCLKKGTLPLPKSTHEDRIIKNLDIEFEMSIDDIDALDSLDGIGTKKAYRY